MHPVSCRRREAGPATNSSHAPALGGQRRPVGTGAGQRPGRPPRPRTARGPTDPRAATTTAGDGADAAVLVTGLQHAELVALGIGEHHPRDIPPGRTSAGPGAQGPSNRSNGSRPGRRAESLARSRCTRFCPVLGLRGHRHGKRGRSRAKPTSTSSESWCVIGRPSAADQKPASASGSAASTTTLSRRVVMPGNATQGVRQFLRTFHALAQVQLDLLQRAPLGLPARTSTRAAPG